MPRPLRALVLADDSDFLAELLPSLATRAGWEPPSHAADGLEAVGYLDGVATPDVLIIDVGSPALHGPELLRRIRADLRFQRTAVVVTGARLGPAERAAFLPGEVWLSKPFDADDLTMAVQLAQDHIAAEAR